MGSLEYLRRAFSAAAARAVTTVTMSTSSWIPPARAPWSVLTPLASWIFLTFSVVVAVLYLLNARVNYSSDSIEILSAMSGIFLVPCFLLLSMELLTAWVGVWVAWSGVLLILIIVALSSWDIGRRERNLANPFRQMLSVDLTDEVVSRRTSSIDY